MKLPRNQTGFTAIELIIVVVVLAAVGVIGYQVYSAKSEKPEIQNQTTSNTQSKSPKEISGKVSAFYQLYTGNNPMSAGVKSIQELEQYGYLTTEASQKLTNAKGADPILCTQGGSDQPFRFDDAAIGQENATVKVKQYYEGQKSDNIIDVTLRLSDLRIIDIKCNP